MTKQEKLAIAYPCQDCHQQGIYCADSRSKCFGEPCGIVPCTGKNVYEEILHKNENCEK